MGKRGLTQEGKLRLKWKRAVDGGGAVGWPEVQLSSSFIAVVTVFFENRLCMNIDQSRQEIEKKRMITSRTLYLGERRKLERDTSL